MASSRLIETFNTHRMSDDVIRALAIGRDSELDYIVPTIRRAAAAPQGAMPALIVYGERGSGKSFLMRLVQMACAEVEHAACVLLPEEQYNLRTPQQLLQIVSAHLRGDDWAGMSWQFDKRDEESAWDEELGAFHAALDARFGAGRGIAVVLLENFDAIVEKLFGAKAPKVKRGTGQSPMLARRQAEERLRKLLNACGGRYLLLASATGTIDMDYERPLFKAFHPVDLQGWSAETALDYFNKRRQLENQPPLTAAEEARARAVIEFIGGNVRLAQLLGTVLNTDDAQGIAELLDELVDKLADYYRQRMDALPGAAAGVLDALIRGGEPVTQTALAQRIGGEQPQIADAFSYLLRGRLLAANSARPGGAQHYQVRDRLFVHFYRRRYGQASGLAAIAGLLEQFFTPDEREARIREHLARGEFDAARAFGRLPLEAGGREHGYCSFRDNGITDGPPRPWFVLAGLSETETAAARQHLRDHPDQAFTRWRALFEQGIDSLQRAAAAALAAVAASRNGYDLMAQHELEAAIEMVRAANDADAAIVALNAASIFYWHRYAGSGQTKSLELSGQAAELAPQARHNATKAIAYWHGSFHAWQQQRYDDAEKQARIGLAVAEAPLQVMGLSYYLAGALIRQQQTDVALTTLQTLEHLAVTDDSRLYQYEALFLRVGALIAAKRYAEAIPYALPAADLAAGLGWTEEQARLYYQLAVAQRATKNLDAALTAARQGLAIARAAEPPEWEQAGCCAGIAVEAMLDEDNQKPGDEAVELSKQALEYARHTQNRKLLYAVLNQLINLATLRPIPEALAALSEAMDDYPGLELLGEDYSIRNNWPLAAAKADGWATMLAAARRHPQLPAMTDPWWPERFRQIAQRWVETFAQSGRAAAYAEASAALPTIEALLALHQLGVGETAQSRTQANVNTLTAALTEHCKDPGLLRDLAGLLVERYGNSADASAARLREFAALHAAEDKQAFLLSIDPDLALAMRRMFDLPDAKDNLALRGRPRAR